MNGEMPRASLTRRIGWERADAFALGWKEAILIELTEMRALMPDADMLDLRLGRERHPAGE